MERSRLRRWFKRPNSVDPPMLELVATTGFEWPREFSISKYPGLIACELVRMNDGTSRIQTLWRDATALQLRGDALGRELSATRGASGTVADIKTGSRWLRQSPGDVILKLSALIGAVTVVTSLLASWFAVPSINLILDRPQPVNAGLGAPVTFKLLVLNNSRTSAANVDISAEGSTAKGLVTDTPRVTLPGGGQAVVTLTMSFDAKDNHRIRITARSRAGLFIPARTQSTDVVIKTWPDYEFGPFEVSVNRTTAKVGFIRSTLSVAQNVTRLACTVTADPVPSSVKFLSVDLSSDGGTPKESAAVDGTHTITIAWHAELARPFEPEAITLNLESSRALTASDWTHVAEKIRPICEVSK